MQTFTDFERLLAIKRYSTATIKTYSGQLHVFAEFLGSARPLHRLEKREPLNGVLQIVEKRRYMFSTHQQLIGALSLYLSQVHGRDMDFSPVYPTRRPRHLPEILSLREVKAVIEKLPNLKHRAMLTMVYALGLRSGELIDLRIKDIAGDRGLVHIKKAKGNKDRILPLPDKLRLLLREYYREYRPVGYLFNGQGGGAYSPQSLRKVFHNSCTAVGIRKKVTLHSLRHAYATHLLEAGTSIRVIQELLGHSSIKTTMLYTHVSRSNIENVKSPLDFL